MLPLRKTLFAVWGVQTTGQDPATDRVVEIGLTLCTVDKCLLRTSLFVDPGMPIPVGATADHGITDADVAGAPSLLEALETLGNVMPFPPTIYVAHSPSFEQAFLGLSERPWVSTLEMAWQLYPNRAYRLMTICQDLGIRLEDDARRVEAYSFATAQLLQEMLRALPELETTDDLVALGGVL